MIGGGDFAKEQDYSGLCACLYGGKMRFLIRNPYSIRPFQHVLEPLYAYLMIAEQQAKMPINRDIIM